MLSATFPWRNRMLVLWPGEPADEDLQIILKLHPEGPTVVPYDSEVLLYDELNLVEMIKRYPDACVYALQGATVQVAATILANLTCRVVEMDEYGSIDFIYEIRPVPETGDSAGRLCRIWPLIGYEEMRRRRFPPTH